MKFIDSHAHLTSLTLYDQIEEVLARAKQAGITSIINVCTDAETLLRGLKLQEQYPWIYNAAATHPHDVDSQGELLFETMAQHARSGYLVAIGETGLDYHYNHSAKLNQQYFLRRNLKLAAECRLPIIIHCREAFDDFFSILDDSEEVQGVLHCFTGTLAEAENVLKRGWYISFSGIITFKKSEELREIAKIVPLDKLLIETDAPFLAPQTKRGKLNESSYLPEIANAVAYSKNISLTVLADATSQNARRFFNLPN